MKQFKKIPTHIWILMIIVLIGVFLRTYHLHEWLKFRNDQARDADLVSQVVNNEKPWPLLGPYMSYSGDGDHIETNAFHLGPIYYYFQITAALIFGNYADKLAYPDVFFGIVSIPLLYLFLRIAFTKNVSLGITFLYAISSYFVQYSRFAWNTNLIPFFVLLLLFSLYKFLEKGERVSWWWAAALGSALGVGVQLHVIVLAIFCFLCLCVFVFSLKEKSQRGIWKQWVMVFFVAGLFNVTQIVNELQTNFSNTKTLFTSASRDNSVGVGRIALLRNDINCHIEANAYFLSSYGSSNCAYEFLSPAVYDKLKTKSVSKFFQDIIDRFIVLSPIIFSLAGYFLLIRSSFNETEKKKRLFFRLIGVYAAITFVVMIPLSSDKFNDMRYMTPVFFVPFVLFGCIVTALGKRLYQKKIAVGILLSMIFILLTYTNVLAIAAQVVPLLHNNRTCSSHSTTLGELEPVADYLVANSNSQKPIYFGGDKAFRVVYTPLAYILEKRGVGSVEISADPAASTSESQTYMISCKSKLKERYPFVKIGNIMVFRIR